MLRGGLCGYLFSPNRRVCSVFDILGLIEDDNSSLSIPVNKSSTYVLQKYASKCKFVCENYESWEITFSTKMYVSIVNKNLS